MTRQRCSVYKQTIQQGTRVSQRGPDVPTGAHDPQHALQKKGGWQIWHMEDGDITCHPILVLPFLQDFNVANAGVGAERSPQKTEVTYNVNDLNAAPPEWKTDEVRSMAKISAVTSGSITLGVAIGSQQFITDQHLSKADVIRAMLERVQLCQDQETELACFERVWESVVSTTSCEFMVTKCWRNKVQRRFTMKLCRGPSNGSSRVSRRTA